MVEQELLTLPDHPVFSGGHIGFCVQLHVFMFLVLCYNVNYDFARTIYALPFFFVKGSVLLSIYLICIYLRILISTTIFISE
jgi:hypothetical protein